MTREWARATLARLLLMQPVARWGMLRTLPPPAFRAIVDEWFWQAHGGQVEPGPMESGAPWRVWSLIAGRGFGKTRVGAEWVWARARAMPEARIALVAASRDEVARVMVEGESGLLSVARSDEEARWLSSRGIVAFPTGARAFAYTAERPGTLRGPQHHFAWADELAKWPRGDQTWDNLMLGLRLGDRPRTVVTTTPGPAPLVKRVLAMPGAVHTRGRTRDNPHLPSDFLEAVTAMYGGTRLGRQELDGQIVDEIAGALWTREMLEAARTAAPLPVLERVVVGVDPPASSTGDACGIVVCGAAADGIVYVLGDHSLAGMRPEGWARRVADVAAEWGAGKVVAEKNQGGEMVDAVLRGADVALPVKLVHARHGEGVRAEPVALRFETGRARLAGAFPELEDELCALTYSGFQGAGGSPDRADAMIWAMTELIAPRGEPGVRML